MGQKKRKRNPPAITIYKNSNQYMILINRSALELLVQDGERTVVILRDKDGTIFIKPLTYKPDEELAYVKVVNPVSKAGLGMARVSGNSLKNILDAGKYKVCWDDNKEALKIERGGK